MAAPNEITPQQLLRLIGTPNCPQIVDISIDPDFDDDPHLIPGAFCHPHTDLQGLITRLSGQPSIIICQKGIKLSQGMAAQFRSAGLQSEYLSGGNYGWRDLSQAPRIPSANLPPMDQGHSLWVTRHRPKINRIACLWLIRRFVDKDARFLFVSPAEVIGVSERYNAIPFDIEDTFWSHRGDTCTFDTMLDEFKLRTPALDCLSKKSFVPQIPTTMTLRQRLQVCWHCQWAYHANTVTIWNSLRQVCTCMMPYIAGRVMGLKNATLGQQENHHEHANLTRYVSCLWAYWIAVFWRSSGPNSDHA